MESEIRYFTTPIYYANGKPHAGHVYATLLVNILKNHYLSRGFHVKSLTGLDEHGEAVQEKANEMRITPQDLVDKMADEWRASFASLKLNFDIFLRTTDISHVNNVKEILTRCYENGDIYFGEHEGYYCIKCEGFLNSTERDENNFCLIHKRQTELRKEGNYFFKVSKYKEKLFELISHGHIVEQERYKNELLNMLDSFQGDLSISRPKSRLTWGVELPFDSNHVAYVWFDALPNYVSGIGGIQHAKDNKYWQNVVHILGKDILKFHGIFWPAMCLALNIQVPKLLVTGWLVQDGHKMSKSLGNGISVEHILHYGKDMFINFVFRTANPGDDIEISLKSYFERYNADLANGLGNLTSRTLAMVEKYFASRIPSFYPELLSDEEKEFEFFVKATTNAVKKHFDHFKLADALQDIWVLIAKVDKFITQKKPWEIAKANDATALKSLSNTLAISIAVLRAVALLSRPFFPEKMDEILAALGEDTTQTFDSFERINAFYQINSQHTFTTIPKLYERLDIAAELGQQTQSPKEIKSAAQKETKSSSAAEAPKEQLISMDDFSKLELRVGLVTSAEIVEGSDKLLRLIVSLGEQHSKQIFSGVKQWIKPEDIVGRKVVIVANLAPRKMKFGLSEGMLLSTDTIDDRVSPIFLPEFLKEGARLS